MEKYEFIEELGKGTFAVVTKAKDLNTDEIVAVKTLKKKYQTWQECVDLREVKSLENLKHDHIIRLKEIKKVKDTLHMVFEYMEKNLYEMMMEKQSKKFSEGQIRTIMYQTLQGIAHMHKYGFFHRDLKPENLLVNGDVVKIADFGLAREIRSLPPYTDYIATRYYRAPECILKSTNYNSPIDIWALGCIMVELYSGAPLFFGNTEKEVLFRMCSILGTPTNTSWPEGLQLAKKVDLKFPTCPGTPISQIITEASKEAIDLIYEMLKWDPHKRQTASTLLQHPYFTKYTISNRINTPDYTNTNIPGTNFKTYTNKKKHDTNKDLENITKISSDSKKEEDDFSKLLEDTKGFNAFIEKIKGQTYENKNPSPISKKIDDDFDLELEKYLKDNNTHYSNMNNSNSLNNNISSINLTGILNQNTTITTQTQTLYNQNGNFFDTTTLNKINGNKSHSGDSGSCGSNDKESILKDDNIFMSRRTQKEEKMKSNPEVVANQKQDLDFDNCDINLKPKNENSKTRKGSAIKFLEEKLKTNTPTLNILMPNSVKSTKDPMNDKTSPTIMPSFNNPSSNFNSNIFNKGLITTKPNNNITTSNNIQSNFKIMSNPIPSNTDKKPEYQSRRRNINNILNEFEDVKIVDLNLNTNKSELGKNDHMYYGKKNNMNNFGSGFNKESNYKIEKDILIGESSYKKQIPSINNVNNFSGSTGSILNTEGINYASRRNQVNAGNNINMNGANSNILSRLK